MLQWCVSVRESCLLMALEKGCLTREEMHACAKRIINLILKID